MKGKEFLVSIDDPNWIAAQTEGGIKAIFGSIVWFHYTVLRPDLSMTYGGLHKTRAGAEAAKQELIKQAKKDEQRAGPRVAGYAEEWKENCEVTEVLQGQDYHEWGVDKFRHGFNDGTHGSPRKAYYVNR